ncbi:hypothetical protein GCM10023354_17260 [Garicola koreensis]|uniref:VOC family protein n=1 Tax=Garicola koreensis TaxID=1262554 RepID=A0A7W5XYM9_9MICC|nr:hypothetical protein [Garicola koreensis]
MSVPMHHSRSYIEFGVTDLAAARVFYKSAFGWEFNDYGSVCSGIRAPGGNGEVGGLNPGSAPSDEGPIVLLFTAFVGTFIARISRGRTIRGVVVGVVLVPSLVSVVWFSVFGDLDAAGTMNDAKAAGKVRMGGARNT